MGCFAVTARDALLLALLSAGKTDELVGALLQVHPCTVADWRRAAGVGRERRETHRSQIARARLAMAANDMLWEGMPRAAICLKLGISARTLARYIRPELRGTLAHRYSASTRRKLGDNMRRRVQPLGAAASRGIGFGRRVSQHGKVPA